MDPIDEALLLQTVERLDKENELLKARVAVLEEMDEQRGAVDARRDSFEIGTPSKGGNLKHYYDPGAAPDENDRLLAEQARNFINGGGTLPETFSPRIKAMLTATESLLAGGKLPTEGVQ